MVHIINCPRCRYRFFVGPGLGEGASAIGAISTDLEWARFCLHCGFFIEPGAAITESPVEEYCALSPSASATADKLPRTVFGGDDDPVWDTTLVPSDLDARIDALTMHDFCPEARVDYKRALGVLLGRDPATLAYDEPANALDEAAVGWAVSAWTDGLRLGAAIAAGRADLTA